MKFHTYLVIILICTNSYAQVTPPCGNDYGSSADETNIVSQMRYGSIIDAESAINLAKNTRGSSLGCPQFGLTYATPNISQPSLASIETIWNTVHAPAISAYNVTCPRIGRYESNSALGAYYAMQAGYYTDTSKLSEIADMMYDQQYADWNINTPQSRNEGVYGYISTASSDPCYPGGVVGASVTAVCSALPAYCVTYSGGQFSGLDFLISGQDDANNWHDGGLAYDHGWIGTQMIESAIMQSDYSLKQKYRNSVELAGQYALSEFSVKNHNYTAKLIWLLSELYTWTGDTVYKNELNYKLNKNLLPGILFDADNDGNVDGTSPPIAFSSLTSTAQTPGRMWDGHNSLPWYHAMNAWALTEAYVAFRDQGDTVRANELKPYVVTMLDNLADEIINQGVITPDALGVRDITYALLSGIWKVSQYESAAHLNWNQAAWAMWNTGYFNTYNTHSVCVGLYLIVESGTPYIPLNLRESFALSTNTLTENRFTISLFPNPTDNILTIEINGKNFKTHNYKIIDILGNQLVSGILSETTSSLDVSGLSKGQYFLSIFENENRIESLKFVRE
ncbi:MAG: hypothetical protein ACI81Y_002791 [Glaciecola sp.]|jgi:hypothetical protein